MQIKILSIGNSFSQDATEYLWHIFNNAGYEKVVIGNLYIGGCSLDTHYDNIVNDNPHYVYYKTDNGVWTEKKETLYNALVDEEWDFITMQQSSGLSGISSSYENLDNIIKFVNDNKTNKCAKLLWHMTWAYQQNSDRTEFSNYNKKQILMYNSIVKVVKERILSNPAFSGIIPNGTAVQILRTSSLGDTITRDGFHLSYDIGRYLAGLTFFKALSSMPIDDINYLPQNEEYAKNINDAMPLIKKSVNLAIKSPLEITKI